MRGAGRGQVRAQLSSPLPPQPLLGWLPGVLTRRGHLSGGARPARTGCDSVGNQENHLIGLGPRHLSLPQAPDKVGARWRAPAGCWCLPGSKDQG